MTKNKGGRPTKMTPETVKKLEDAFIHGATDEEACFYAGISKVCLYSYQEKNPEYADRKASLKESLSLRAKVNLSTSIDKGNVTDSKWLLERKCKDEFGLRVDSHYTGDVTVNIKKFTGEKQEEET